MGGVHNFDASSDERDDSVHVSMGGRLNILIFPDFTRVCKVQPSIRVTRTFIYIQILLSLKQYHFTFWPLSCFYF